MGGQMPDADGKARSADSSSSYGYPPSAPPQHQYGTFAPPSGASGEFPHGERRWRRRCCCIWWCCCRGSQGGEEGRGEGRERRRHGILPVRLELCVSSGSQKWWFGPVAVVNFAVLSVNLKNSW
uniref:Uncharacterized protein n=1 Tax=Zea mays TaxID=4577 RepID=B6TC41_MAIZE|nr:hypothetical protein [Zea mays]